MASRANIAGHPIHPMLVVFPIGLWVFSLVADLIYEGSQNEVWSDTAYYAMAGGVLGALAAAVPGMIDLFSMTDRDTKRIGILHMTLNLAIVVLFIINLWWRMQVAPQASGPVWLSVVAIALLLVSGWLGGEMVYVHGAGVSPIAFTPGTEKITPYVIVERRRPETSGMGYAGPERRVPVHAPREDRLS